MNPSDLRERVTIQRLSGESTWADISPNPTVWAGVQPTGEETYLVRIRYRSDLRGMKDAYPALRVVWKDRVLEVTNIIESEWHRELHIIATHTLVEVPSLGAGVKRKQPWPA